MSGGYELGFYGESQIDGTNGVPSDRQNFKRYDCLHFCASQVNRREDCGITGDPEPSC